MSNPNPKRTRDPSQYIPELKNNTATPLVKCFANKSNHGSEFAQMRLQSLPCALTQTREQLQRRSTHHVALAAACAHHEIVCSLCCVSDTRMNSGKLILCLESFNTISLEKGWALEIQVPCCWACGSGSWFKVWSKKRARHNMQEPTLATAIPCSPQDGNVRFGKIPLCSSAFSSPEKYPSHLMMVRGARSYLFYKRSATDH